MKKIILLSITVLIGMHSFGQGYWNQQRDVYINGQKLPDQLLAQYEQMSGAPIPRGRYWYDKNNGWWGVEGGPAIGVIAPHINLGGALRPNASNGNSGIYLNGRELTANEGQIFYQIYGSNYGNRFVMDAYGNVSTENGIWLNNLYALAQKARGSTNPSRGDDSYIYHSKPNDAFIGGNGKDSYIHFEGGPTILNGEVF